MNGLRRFCGISSILRREQAAMRRIPGWTIRRADGITARNLFARPVRTAAEIK
jgi:hypothetical protein